MTTTHSHRGLRRCWLLVPALALAACGGGGGGEAPVTPTTAATLDAARQYPAAAGALRAVEAPLMLAQLATNWVSELARDGNFEVIRRCGDEGSSLRLTLTDADGNGLPSAGDRVDIVIANCTTLAYALLSERLVGRMTVRIATAADAAAGTLSGEVSVDDSFGERFVSGTSRRGLQGTLAFDRVNGLLEDRLKVQSASTGDLRFTATSRSSSGIDTVRADVYTQLSLTRTIQREQARVFVSGGLRNLSDELGGWVDIALPSGLGSFMDVVPDQGRVEVRGAAGTRVSVSPSGDESGEAVVSRDADGDGRDDASERRLWDRMTTGYLASPGNSSQGMSPVRWPAMSAVWVPSLNSNAQSPSEPILLQFSHSIGSPAALYALLTEDLDGTLGFQNGTDPTLVDGPFTTAMADVEVRGALMIVRPRQPLRHGATYTVTLSTSSTPDPLDRVMLGGGDGIFPLGPYTGVSFKALDNLWIGVTGAGTRSLLMPGRPVALAAIAPAAKALPLRFGWTQLSGPAVQFSDPNSASPTVSLAGAIPAGSARVRLEVTVTDARGRTGTRPVELQVASTAGLQNVLYLASEKGDYVGGGAVRLLVGPETVFSTSSTLGYAAVRAERSNPLQLWNLDAGGPSGSLPAVGIYAGASGQASLVEAVPLLRFSGDGRACSLSTGRFEVLEIVLNAQGTGFSRLAVDFEQRCSGFSAALRGSLRIGSDLPIRP